MRKPLTKYVSRFFLVCTVVAVMTANFISTTTVFAVIGDGASSNIQLFDTNSNGIIDQITFDIANPNLETWTLSGVMPYGLSVTQNAAPVTITNVSLSTLANANPVVVQVDLSEVGGLTDTNGVTANPVELIYTGGTYGVVPNIQDSVDDVLNAISTGDTNATDTEIDKAAPQISNATSTNPDATYGPGSAINISLSFTEFVSSANLAITLDNGITVNTGALTNQGSFAGNIYNVGATGNAEDSADLSITGIVGTMGDGIQPTVNPVIPAGKNINDNKAIVIDTTAPTVTGANISIAGGTGTGSAYIVGDTITVTWDNSGAGDNNTDLNTAVADLSGWGGLPALIMTDTAACGGTAADNIYEACYTIAGTEGIDGININATVTATDNTNNTSATVADTTNATVDTIAPTLNSGNLSIDTSACTGTSGICIVGDTITFRWNNTVGGDNNADEDSTLIMADLTNFGGGAAQLLYDDGTNGDSTTGDDIYTYTYTISAGTNDGLYTYDLTVTDLNGNSFGPVTSTDMATVDNEAPTVTVGCISVTGATGTAGAFKVGDTPAPTWADTGCDNNTDTIANVVFDASDFRALDTAVAGFDSAGIWVGTIAGPMDPQDTINNNVDVSVTDDAGNTTTVTGTNNYTIDAELPSFTAVQTVEALKQDGAAPTASTAIWYYYPTQNLRLQVNNASETDGNDLVSVKACMRSMNEDVPAQTCSPADFANPANYQSLTINAGADDSTLNYALAGLPSGWPTQVDSYEVNFELTDDAGNVWWSANAAEFYHAVFNVDPKVIYTGVPDINNATTTDWATITDFTAATNVVFNANDGTNDVGRITITGPVNLTTLTAINELQNLATNMTVTGDQGTGAIDAKIDSTNLSIFDTGASLMIRVPSGAAQPGIVVRDDADAIAGYIQSGSATGSAGGDNLTGITWNAGAQELTFNTDGFTSFGADQTVPTETITPANASTGVATTTPIVVTFSEEMDTSSFTYTLVPSPGGEVVTWSAGDTVATINHTAFANSTSYTFTVTAANDMVGNPSAGSASTFTTVAVVPPSGGGGGGAGGRAVITTPTEETTTEETPAESYEAPLVFSDVAGHWAEDYIYQAKEEGYIRGYEDETFRPNQNINRAEAAKLIAMWLNASIGEDVCAEGLFPDVNCSLWYGKYVAYLYNAGIIQGYPDGNFAPGNYINRAEALKMMLFAKALQDSSIADVINPFSDVSANQWFYNYVMVGYKLSIIQGYGDGTFGPGRNITRAEFTKIFVETLLNN